MNKHTDYLPEILAALRAEGLQVNDIVFDGKIRSVPTAHKPNKKNGRYIAHAKPLPVVWYKNWETDSHKIWTPNNGRVLTKVERKKFDKLMVKIKKSAVKEEAERHAQATTLAQKKYDAAEKCSSHPYLKLKGVSPVPGLKIDSRGLLVVPLKDAQGKIMTIQIINDHGIKRYLPGGKKKGSFFRIGKVKDASTLLVCEGLSTGLSLYESCNIPTVVAADKENLLPVAGALRTRYPDKKITLCADNDIKDGCANVGIEKASAAALAVDGLIAVPELRTGEKCDFNDLHQQEGKERVATLVKCAMRPYGMPEIEPLPRGYSFKPNGLHLDLYHENTRLGRALYILAEARDVDSKDWGKILGCYDSDNMWHTEYIPNASLQGGSASWMGILANMGWKSATGLNVRRLLEDYLVGHYVSHRARLVSATGWYKNVYVLPDEVIGNILGERPTLYPAPLSNPYTTGGTLKGWQGTIGTWAVGNSRMTLAICATLAGFLLVYYQWAESFGIHFFGGSSKGKSTSLQGAASCCGLGALTGGFIHSWLATSNALGALAASHSDAPLFLDEMGKASAHVVSEAAYTIAGGQDKARLDQNSILKKIKKWRCIVLSSGEKTFAGKLAEASITPQAGQMVRLLDIPAPADTDDSFLRRFTAINQAMHLLRLLNGHQLSITDTSPRLSSPVWFKNHQSE